MRKLYPRDIHPELKDMAEALAFMSRARTEDLADWNNLTNVFMKGRKVGKIPTSSSDVTETDKVGDFNYSASYLYICVDNAGTNVWRRVALASW